MSALPEVSVVVPTRDRAGRLEGLLRSLAQQTLAPERFEVIVVDDGSTDRTAEMLAGESRRARLRIRILRGRGSGPAVARNAGWRAAQAPLVAFTDDDCEAAPDWLERLAAAAAEHPGAVIQGSTTPIPRELERTAPFTRTKSIVEPSPWFQTCNIAYPRDLLARLGGFDERFREPQGEDVDLGWRARELGARPVWCASARIHHAVEDVGAVDFLRDATRSAGAVSVFRRHPALRGEALRWGIVRNPRVPSLALALAGLWLARRSAGLGALLVLPYARRIAGICRVQRASFTLAPYYALWDILFVYTSLRGSLRDRTLVL
jgi:glycosyltransferase involved in cell wall biosynthesis